MFANLRLHVLIESTSGCRTSSRSPATVLSVCSAKAFARRKRAARAKRVGASFETRCATKAWSVSAEGFGVRSRDSRARSLTDGSRKASMAR